MRQKDLPVLEVEACKTIVTNAVHGNARINYEKTHKNLIRIREEVIKDNTIPVIEGFVGCSDNGEITTLGRGGSDYTATTIAALLAIKNVYLVTDVDGIYSADPKLVSSPIIVRSMDYSEGVEAAKYGVKRFNAKMFEPLIKYYPSTIYVGNESRFGTKIQKASSNVNGSKPKIIAYKNLYNRSLIAIIGNIIDRAKLIHKASSALSEVNVSFTAAVLPPASPSVVLLFNDKLDAQTVNTLHDALIGSE
jgi:aspartate kinase